MPRRRRSFDEQVDRSGECWLWLSSRGLSGYGRFYVGFADGKSQWISAHRYAWERANRPLRPGEMVLHRCDTPLCVRPDHLWVGSGSDNIQDAVAKGRMAGSIHGKGEAHRFAKLTADDIQRIRALTTDGLSRADIARRFGVDPSQISRIVHGQRWNHI